MAKESTNKNSNMLIRALRVLHDFYVTNLLGCAKSSARMASAMPRSRSRGFPGHMATSGDDDVRDLVRVASRALRPKDEVAVDVVPRSQSVAAAIGRIDENCSCEFDGGGDGIKVGPGSVYPRSRSAAVVGERMVRVVG